MTSIATNAPPVAAEARAKSPYIISPLQDHVFLIWSPLIFFAIGAAIHYSGVHDLPFQWFGDAHFYLFPTLAMAFSLGHIFCGLARTHLNQAIFKTYPIRFTVIPIAIYVGTQVSHWFFIIFAVTIVWMDVWHSSMQTFGFARLYNRKAGNPDELGRKLDWGMALFTYAGPAIGGASLAYHLERMSWFEQVGFNKPTLLAIFTVEHQAYITWPLIIGGVGYTAFYIFSYYRLHKQGHRYPVQKVMLWSALTLTSVLTWGLDSFGQAYLIMESFHALQYFAIVWWSEKKNLTRIMHLDKIPGGRALVWSIFVGVSLLFGFWCAMYAGAKWAMAIYFVCEGLHYWADGFVWSVRKKQI